MTTTPRPADDDVDEDAAGTANGHQVSRHPPDEETVARARRILTGEMSPEQAVRELAAKHGIDQ